MNLRYIPIAVLFFLPSAMDLLISQSCSDLYISEYIEGSSNNKCIEIYNPTPNSIDLSSTGYALKFFFNGSTSAGTTINLAGMLPGGDVYVVCDNDAAPAFLAVADQTSTSSFYNGDDAVLLLRGTDTLDIIGVIGNDPGTAWTGSSVSTLNQTLVRRPGVKSGIVSNPASFNPSLEWISYAQDFAGNLGAHYQDPCPCTELYFSEYLEGSSNSKALEIYNPTTNCVDLAEYTVYRFNNGSSTALDSMHFNQMLCPGEVYVIANPSAAAPILNVADTTHTITFFNGDDAIVLSHLTRQIDIIGIIGVDPGTNWPVGSGATSEFTLVRMSSVNSPTIDWSVGATQWNVFPQNTFDSLGTHFQNACSLSCDSMVVVTEGMNPCSGAIDALSYGLFWYIQTTQPVMQISSTHGAVTMQIAPDTLLVSMMNIPSGDPAEVVLVGGVCGDTLRLRDTISCDVCDFILPPNAGDETFCGDPSPTVVPTGGGFPGLKVTSDLFFSEYTEGSGFNKCLELFNGTGQNIDLASGFYTIDIYFNGNTTATSHVDLTGIIPDQGTFVICDDGATMAFLSLADLIDNNLSFNGDDAITLSHNGVIIDVIGQIGVDPGSQWGSGVQSTADNTLIRRPTIFKGDENPADPFLPATEWDGFATDHMADLGMHTYSAMDTLPEYYNFYDGDPAMGGMLIASGPSLSVASSANDSTIYVTALSMGCESAAVPLTFRSLQVESPSCQDLVHISLTTGCDREILVGDVLSGAYSCTDAFDLILTNTQGVSLASPLVNLMDVGSSFTYRIRNRYDGATCWGTIQVEKKFPPVIECRDVTIACTDTLPLPPVPISCDPYIRTTIHNQSFTHEDCDSRFTGYYDRSILVEDAWGNQQSCNQRIWVEKATLTNLMFPDDEIIECRDPGLTSFVTSTLDENGYYHPIPYIIQGINIGLVEAPSIDGNYLDPRIDHCNIITLFDDVVLPACGMTYTIRRNWIVKDWCTGEEISGIQYIRIIDTLAPKFEKFNAPEVTYNVHDCKAAATFYWPEIKSECSSILDLKWRYELSYQDPQHPGKEVAVYGEVAYPDPVHFYLPFGNHDIRFDLRDGCENDTTFYYRLSIQDELPPEPVCDEITQVTLDPEQCWARVYAKDLDDGSHDACCDRLHFAVANMDSVTYWRNYWRDYFSSCLDPYDYHHNYNAIEAAIEEWINVFVFDDYIDVTECGEEQLVLRVYEACGLPAYDDHLFSGGEHEWFWWNLSDRFARWYWWRLNDYIHYGDPRPQFDCSTGDFEWKNPVVSVPGVGNFGGPYGYENFIDRMEIPDATARLEWESRVGGPYQGEVSITKTLLGQTRWYFYHLYNDCMIRVLKDDKTPPLVIAPEDVTVYCDGVPYWWELTKPYAGGTKTATVKGHGASFTHDVCEGEDALATYCADPYIYPVGWNTSGAPVEVTTVCCVEIPWDGGDFGYYGGSVCGESNYAGGVNCDEYSYWYHDHNWQPIYCRLWLMLDQYDNPDGGHPNPQSYFDETAEDWVITDNCWAPETEVQYSGSLNECGVGTLTKTVTATDKCGNTAYDTQTLYVKPRSDFEVIFPADVVVNCTDPGSLAADRTGAGYPEISDDDCELIGVTYSDERYDVTEGCYKILRTWKLIDWCVYSPDLHSRYPDVIVDDRLVASDSRCCIHRNLKDDGDGYMTYLQVIKVIDDEAPVIVCNALEETCILDNNCDAATVRYELLASGTDNCAAADEIQYRYTVLAEETTPVAYGQGHELTAELAVGTYGVWLVGKDRCGNEDSCYTTFTIRDCKNPTPYCYHGIATVVMSPSGEVEIWATDFDAGSYDNCTTADNLILSFTEDGETPSITFTCADIPDGRSQEIEVEIWVIDEAGNKDFCTTTLLLQDNSGNVCQDSSPLTESGSGVASPGQKVKGEGIRTPELYQNTPNPFSGETKIGFWLPESMTATLRVMDVTGKELYRVTGSYSGGNHLITLEAGSIPEVKGVLFYQLETEKGVLNKRMVRVN